MTIGIAIVIRAWQFIPKALDKNTGNQYYKPGFQGEKRIHILCENHITVVYPIIPSPEVLNPILLLRIAPNVNFWYYHTDRLRTTYDLGNRAHDCWCLRQAARRNVTSTVTTTSNEQRAKGSSKLFGQSRDDKVVHF